MTSRPAAGGGRWVLVAPERLETWLAGFTRRHGPAATDPEGADLEGTGPEGTGPEGTGPEGAGPEGADLEGTGPEGAGPEGAGPEGAGPDGTGPDGTVVRLRAEDGAIAECHVPFPPLGLPRGVAPAPEDLLRALVAHALTPRRVGVLLVRLGGHAAGVFEGSRLVVSKVGSRQVHGRSAAGGWSQKRFARRREKQAAEASGAAADTAVRVLVPHLATLDAVVLGGDRRAMTPLRADRRLAPLFALETPPFLDVPDPRLAVLQRTPGDFRSVRVRVLDPPSDGVDNQER